MNEQADDALKKSARNTHLDLVTEIYGTPRGLSERVVPLTNDLAKAEKLLAVAHAIGVSEEQLKVRPSMALWTHLLTSQVEYFYVVLGRMLDRDRKAAADSEGVLRVLNWLNCKSHECPKVQNVELVTRLAREAGMPSVARRSIQGPTGQKFALEVRKHFQGRFDSPDFQAALERVFTLRDKRLAHQDRKWPDVGPMPNEADTMEALDFVRHLVSVLGAAFFGNHLVDDGKLRIHTNVDTLVSYWHETADVLHAHQPPCLSSEDVMPE